MRIFENVDYKKGLQRFSDKFFDLAVEDPEYGVKQHGGVKRSGKALQKNGSKIYVKDGGYEKLDWDNKPAGPDYGEIIFKKSKNQIIFGANYFDWIVGKTFLPPRRNEFQDFIQVFPTGWIIWDKMNGNSDQYDCELAWTSFDRPTIIKQFLWNGMLQGSAADGRVMEGNKKLNQKRFHPTEKPIPFYKWILKDYAKIGNIILDTHSGSGALPCACEDMGFNYVAFEIETKYYLKAFNRINTYRSQLQLKF